MKALSEWKLKRESLISTLQGRAHKRNKEIRITVVEGYIKPYLFCIDRWVQQTAATAERPERHGAVRL